GGAPRADAPLARALGLGFETWKDVVVEKQELPRIAKEVRLVRADAIEQPPALLHRGGILDQAEVLLEGSEIELAQPPGEPAHEEGLLRLVEGDAGLGVDQISILREQLVADLPPERR